MQAQKKHFDPCRTPTGQTASLWQKRPHFDRERRTAHSIPRSLEHGSKRNRAGCALCSLFSVGGPYTSISFTQSTERRMCVNARLLLQIDVFLFSSLENRPVCRRPEINLQKQSCVDAHWPLCRLSERNASVRSTDREQGTESTSRPVSLRSVL